MPLTWEGEGLEMVGKDPSGTVRVMVDPRYFRPTEVEVLLGNPDKARTKLKWDPRKVRKRNFSPLKSDHFNSVLKPPRGHSLLSSLGVMRTLLLGPEEKNVQIGFFLTQRAFVPDAICLPSQGDGRRRQRLAPQIALQELRSPVEV